MTAGEVKRRDAIGREIERRAIDAKFVRAGHCPEDPNCSHKNYTFAKMGRYCLDCGTCMVDFGD